MRVLAMFHAYLPYHGAGAEGMAHALLRHLVRSGHEVDVILSTVDHKVTADYEFEGVRVHVHRGKTQTPEWICSGMRPHVIVCHLENTPRAAILGKMFKIPVVQIVHNTMPETMNSTQRYDFAMLTMNTRWMVAAYEEYWRTVGLDHPPRVVQVRPPVDPTDYVPKGRIRPGKHVTLVNLTVGKGSHVFYELAKRLPEFEFLGVRGAYGIQVTRNDLPNVTLMDTVLSTEMVTKVYQRSRVVLMPSDYESYGRVGVEAACSGVPVIAHPTDGLREALGPAGIFHDRDDINAWEHEIRRLYTPRGWSVSSMAAREWAIQLDPTAELAQWQDAMQEVASVSLAARHH